MGWLTNFYDFRFKWTAAAGIGIHPDCHSWWISKMLPGREEERYAIKFCFKLGKNATETYGMLQTAFRPSCMNRASAFEWHKRFKEGRESVRDDEKCGIGKEVNTSELIGQTVRVRVTMLRFRKRFLGKRPALFKSGQWHFHQDNALVHYSILVTDYLTKMDIKTVPHPPYSPDFFPCDLWLFPKLRGCCYEAIEEMKEAVTKVIDTLTKKRLPWGLPEVVGMVQQVDCSRRRLLRTGLEFHVCTIKKIAHTYSMILVINTWDKYSEWGRTDLQQHITKHLINSKKLIVCCRPVRSRLILNNAENHISFKMPSGYQETMIFQKNHQVFQTL